MFRRTEKSAPAAEQPVAPTEGKGRPTPTRKEAEAAARERARTVMDKKAAQKVLRDKRTEANRRMREGMRAGDEKYLPARDQGPVRRFVRDWVDSRLMFSEFVLPMLVLIMVLQAVGGTTIANLMFNFALLLMIVDLVALRFRIRKAVRKKFPEEPLRGLTLYALIRVAQLRFLRLPKPKVKLGQFPS